jgi:hypothetical protein
LPLPSFILRHNDLVEVGGDGDETRLENEEIDKPVETLSSSSLARMAGFGAEVAAVHLGIVLPSFLNRWGEAVEVA